MINRDVVIVGAGPYGLSAAAYLCHAGIEPYVVGQPVGFWKKNMPKGMFLRSGIEASNIAAPQKGLSLEGYQKAVRKKIAEPIPIEDFTDYGQWFQRQIAPDLDTRFVRTISRSANGFNLTFDDGERIHAQ